MGWSISSARDLSSCHWMQTDYGPARPRVKWASRVQRPTREPQHMPSSGVGKMYVNTLKMAVFKHRTTLPLILAYR
jgi:hypothetical protein